MDPPGTSVERDHVVVGSGPAGVAAAVALVAAGREVTVVDGGHTLDPGRSEIVRRLAGEVPTAWSAGDLHAISARHDSGSGLAQKWAFGSDFPYRGAAALADAESDVGLMGSLAQGGLSNVWGATLLPYTDRELSSWPIGAQDLSSHYEAVLQFVPQAATHDALEHLYPLHAEPSGVLVPSTTARRLLARAARHEGRLAERGWTVGRARLAVRAGRPAPEAGCIYCRRCLEGCVYDHIWSARSTLADLVRDGAVRYEPGVQVTQVDERAAGVTITAERAGEVVQIGATRVHLAAGVVGSTAIAQRSGLAPSRVVLKDSHTSFIPFVVLGRPEAEPIQAAYTLAQLFLDVDPGAGRRPMQAQIYTWEETMPARMRALRPGLTRRLGPIVERVARQLVVGTCYLHSDDSPGIASELCEGAARPRLTVVPNPRTEVAQRRFRRVATRDLPRLGLVPIGRFGHVGRAGEGFHAGGSLPMHRRPELGQTDLLGRPAGSERVHVIDASCFPDVPAGAVTFTAMANAHRIATAAADLP